MKKKLSILLLLLLFSACSAIETQSGGSQTSTDLLPRVESSEIDVSESSEEERVYFQNLSPENEERYNILTNERGLEEWQLHSLSHMSFSLEEMLQLSDEYIIQFFAPGNAPRYGEGLTQEQLDHLAEFGFDEKQCLVLYNLGYAYEDMIHLTAEQITFIFPNTELFDKLEALGYDRKKIAAASFLSQNGWESYKDLLDEVFEKQAAFKTTK